MEGGELHATNGVGGMGSGCIPILIDRVMSLAARAEQLACRSRGVPWLSRGGESRDYRNLLASAAPPRQSWGKKLIIT